MVASMAVHHYSPTQSTVARSRVKPSVRTMARDSTTGKSMASRVGSSRAMKTIQLRCLYVQDLAATGVVRLRAVPTKENLADLHTKEHGQGARLIGDALKSSMDRYSIHGIINCHSHAQFVTSML